MFLPNPLKYNQNEYIIDEKRKIIVNARALTPLQNLMYKRNFFTTLRPDLTDLDYFQFKEKWKLGENYFNEMRKRLNYEVRRIFFLSSGINRRQKVKLLEEQLLGLTAPHIRGPRFHADRNWVEASKIVNFVDLKLKRINKYGLDYPIFQEQMTQVDCQQKEDEVADRIFREMTKPPKVSEADEQ